MKSAHSQAPWSCGDSLIISSQILLSHSELYEQFQSITFRVDSVVNLWLNEHLYSSQSRESKGEISS
jgi:hypothetical protein